LQAIVAIGANLPGPAGEPPAITCRRAAEALGGIAGFRRIAVSPWYSSAAWPDPSDPPYVNGAALLEGEGDPAELLAALHGLEDAAGRRRSVPNAPRPLDLDLVAMGDRVIRTPALTLPHPRAHERAFVMVPVADIAPDWRHPVLGRTAREIAAALPRDGVARLP